MISDRYFMEIGIYRVRREKFNSEYDRALVEHLHQHRRNYEQLGLPFPDERRRVIEDAFWRSYGGPWHYNQAVGWLRLFAAGSQMRGELWFSSSQRFQRKMARQQLHLHLKAFEMSCERDLSSAEICAGLQVELKKFQADFRRGRFVLDWECFQGVCDYVDWKGLLKGVSSSCPTTG